MELVKPEPLIIGGKAHYTLTSYDPVSIEVDVPLVTEEEVDLALQLTILQGGGGPERLNDDAWIRSQFQVSGAAELRAAMREQLVAMNTQLADDQKVSACANALVDRLVQRVPRQEIAHTREFVERSFALSLQQEGLTQEMFLAQSGMRPSDLELMLDQQAQTTAEHEAAISAWADHRKLQVADDEIPRLLAPGASAEQANELLQDLATMSLAQRDNLRRAALQAKAMEIIVAESSCTYRHETAAEAAARVVREKEEQIRFIQEMQQLQRQAPPEDNGSDDGHPHLKLV